MPCHYKVYGSTTADDTSLDLLLGNLGDELGLNDDGLGRQHPIPDYLKELHRALSLVATLSLLHLLGRHHRRSMLTVGQ